MTLKNLFTLALLSSALSIPAYAVSEGGVRVPGTGTPANEGGSSSSGGVVASEGSGAPKSNCSGSEAVCGSSSSSSSSSDSSSSASSSSSDVSDDQAVDDAKDALRAKYKDVSRTRAYSIADYKAKLEALKSTASAYNSLVSFERTQDDVALQNAISVLSKDSTSRSINSDILSKLKAIQGQ